MKMTAYESQATQRPEVTAAIDRILSAVRFKHRQDLPLFTFSPFNREGLTLSFFLVASNHPGIGSFFYEMITRTLLPGRQVDVTLFFSSVIENGLIVSELAVKFRTAREWEEARRNFDILQQQIQVGLRSPYHAARILELKGMSVDEKRVRIQERVAQVIHRFPERFDYDFFALVQHYFVSARPEFFRFHEARQISENLSGLYLLRKRLMKCMEANPKKRHFFVKVRKRRLHDPFGTREVLGVSVGLNFLGEHELFSQKHLQRAVQQLIPDCELLAESEYLYKDPSQPLHLLYLEIDPKTKGAQRTLSRELPWAFQGKIEKLQRPLFMPRNEEEIMRHVITLGGQLNFSRDLPQTILAFQKQTESELFFTVILARVLLPFCETSETVLEKLQSLNPQLERVKKIGMIRKKYFKEALVFKAKLPLTDFLRDDQSVDLYRARRFVLSELEKVVGEVRDYNGGMLSKQNEVLSALYDLLGDVAVKHRLLVENFFHALYPVEKRSLINPVFLHQLFLLLLDHLEQKNENHFSCVHEGEMTYILIETLDENTKERLLKLPSEMSFRVPPVSLQLSIDKRFFIGFILSESGKQFCEKIRFLNPSFI